jgi:D-arabinose 1-dehydrogenase-like Zn-dependent alcohol dehydrogenase
VPDPRPAADETVIRVRATGMCGSDVKVNGGLIPGLTLPLIQGHEVAGELTEDVGGMLAGQRVAAYIFSPCGVCQWCLRGQDILCATAPRIGFERDGGLAEYLRMRVSDLLPFSDSLPFEQAAVTMDAVLTPWRALRVHGNVRAGDRVLIVGAGGLGLHAVQIAVAAGARVAVIDPVESHRELAAKLGAELTGGPGELAAVVEWSGGAGADVALESSGSLDGFSTAVRGIRAGGTVVCNGYKPGADVAVDSMRLALAELKIVGSRGGTLADARGALAAVERGEIDPLISGTGTLADAPRFLRQLRETGALGRLVVTQ